MSQTWSNILSSQYSVEEMRQLEDIMVWVEEEALGIPYKPEKYRVCHLDEEPTVKEPIENMPLYINDENTVKKP